MDGRHITNLLSGMVSLICERKHFLKTSGRNRQVKEERQAAPLGKSWLRSSPAVGRE